MKRRERGLALITFALALTILIPLIGAGIDTAMLYIVKERLSSAVQLAVRSARRSPEPEDAARRFFDANFPAGFMGVTARKIEYKGGELHAAVEAPTYFMRIFRFQSVTVTASMK